MVDWAREHPKTGSHQSVQWMIADTAIDAHMSRLVSYESLEEVGIYFERLARGEKIPRSDREAISRHTAMAKAFCSEAASRSLERALQVLGAEGFVEGKGLERGYRDSVIAEIYEGTNDIQRLVIARDLLGVSNS
jgi:acyl-CoA dehydrogenase